MQSKKGQSRETGNTGHTRRRKIKQKHNTTTCVGHHYTQTNTNNSDMRRPTDNWRSKRTELRFYAEITKRHS